ncbi:THxN family PEP-CTERM protein [Rhodospirillaceae bacterium SYSU D60014]|uniref:THxN family PEP-CTERM protein n=1 Tax=Virgifigura deserti TaxID=2268457 RepID=UPI0013C43CCD
MDKWQRYAGGGALAFALLVGATGQASAVVVDVWDYTLDNAFTEFAPAGVVGLNDNPTLGAPTRIEWPESFGGTRSALEVQGADTDPGRQSGEVTTNGPAAPGPDLVHFNFPIPTEFESEFLTSGTLTARAVLTPQQPPIGGETGPIETFFEFAFNETPNRSGECVPDAQSVCDDFFALVAVGPTSETFTFDGETYTLLFGSTQLTPQSAETCALVGQAAGCLGFLTQENQTNVFETFISVTREGPGPSPVPEPGMLVLLGTGLLALGIIRRRQAS